MSRIYGIEGVFGETIYKDETGKTVGWSSEGIIPGTTDYFDANNNHVGYGQESVFGGGTVHYSDQSGVAGYSLDGDAWRAGSFPPGRFPRGLHRGRRPRRLRQ